MTSPRRKEWLFDTLRFDTLWTFIKPDRMKMKEFIQSEIERNWKEAVREFAKKVKPENLSGYNQFAEGWKACRNTLQAKVDAALKELEND